jgi:ribosomal peptide maturation radical SAM protein 1
MSHKVLLVSMPFGELSLPSLGPCLLKPALARVGVACAVKYFGLDFFARYFPQDDEGLRIHRHLLAASSLFFLGEWIFASHLFPQVGPPPLPRMFSHSGSKYHGRRKELEVATEFTLQLRESIPSFVADCVARISWSDYRIVGLSSCFNQNLASLALAAEIKKRHPHVIIVMGGANADGPMGSALLKAFPQVDYVFKGEADLTFPTFVQAVLGGAPVPPLPGLEGREEHLRGDAGEASIVRNMDDLPYPDFDDFYEQASATGVANVAGIELPVEASRGCWWGEKHHCTFCGLNREGMAFRSKSSTRLLDELTFLHERYGNSRFSFTDNILDYRYFNDFLPESVRRGWKLDFFFEVKANLTAPKMELLRNAGVTRIQPGIESLSTHVLKLMRKGTSFIQNVECLKNCRAYDVAPIWSHLYGFPGELLEDYERVAEAIPSLHHLQPPGSLNPAIVQRFAPFFDSPELLGIANIRPNPAYAAIYPFDEATVRDLAYYFRDDRPFTPELIGFIRGALSSAIGEWRASHMRGASFDWIKVGESSVVTDTRGPDAKAWWLDAFETAVLRAFDRPLAAASALAGVRRRFVGDTGKADIDEFVSAITDEADERAGLSMLAQLRTQGFACDRFSDGAPAVPTDVRFARCVEQLIDRRFVVTEGQTILALPIVPPTTSVPVAETPRVIALSPA